MPLLDHFHPPLGAVRRWAGFYSAWIAFIARQLNNRNGLPPDHFAEPEMRIGIDLEVDIDSLASRKSGHTDRGIQSEPLGVSRSDTFSVHVFQISEDEAKLHGVIELVTPGSKDCHNSRRALAEKCVKHLKQGVGVILVDIVTSITADIHAEILKAMEISGDTAPWKSTLYAVAYQAIVPAGLAVWTEEVVVGHALPTLPLAISGDRQVQAELEESYLACCASLRIG